MSMGLCWKKIPFLSLWWFTSKTAPATIFKKAALIGFLAFHSQRHHISSIIISVSDQTWGFPSGAYRLPWYLRLEIGLSVQPYLSYWVEAFLALYWKKIEPLKHPQSNDDHNSWPKIALYFSIRTKSDSTRFAKVWWKHRCIHPAMRSRQIKTLTDSVWNTLHRIGRARIFEDK